MEGNHVKELHKKFEDLNEEVSVALRVQQDAIAATSSTGGRGNVSSAKRDALRLTKKTADWRGDVTALANHIDLQLQHSRALRSHYAQSLLSTTATSQKQQEEAESSRLRCLRSDLRLLQDFRVGYMRCRANKNPTLLSIAEEETVRQSVSCMQKAMTPTFLCVCHQKQLKAFVDKNAKKEKMGDKQEQTPLVLELFEMRREITSRISEDLLKDKKQLDVEVG
ncbi:hypothetical protein BBJ28_00000545 [Nothophytophthora sp. Chile5]|nr:hypothetical protein BBJ28_00000545 [Nothophytophthora sp. Chile5]